jgi:hypothetical protein
VTHPEVDLLLYLMDEAFEREVGHSILGNLSTVTEDDWLWQPPGGHRLIADIVGHVGACKYMYDNHAFGDAAMTWEDPLFAQPPDRQRTLSDTIQWLREGHGLLREHVQALDDDDLPKLQRTNWGELKETRWIISVMIQHDIYHAGEINHIRALCQDNDTWAWEPP